MTVLLRVVVGILMIAHGLVHLLYLATDTPEFSFENSWLVPDSSARTLGMALMWASVAAFVLVGLAVWGVPGLSTTWPTLTIAASAISLVLLIVFWSSRLVLGVAIDLALIAIAVARPEWAESIVG